jgi:hypothetical protein
MLGHSAFRTAIVSVFRSIVVGCSMLGLLLATAARADGVREIRQQQSFTAAGLRLDESNTDLAVQYKGAPGRASGRMLVKLGTLGPPSEQCEGFVAEYPVVGGSAVEIFADFSKLIGLIDSGYICVAIGGFLSGRLDGTYVGGVQRFEDASGTFSADFEGVGLGPVPPVGLSASGSITGTIVVD